MRILVGLFAVAYLVLRAPHLTSFEQFSPRAFSPVGPIALLDAPLPPGLVVASFVLALLCAVAATLGLCFGWTGPLFGVSLLWVLSYRNSWGMIFHTENLLVIHALIIGVSRAADAWSLDARRRLARRSPDASTVQDASTGGLLPNGRYGWALRAMCLVVVLSYLVAGVAKLRAAGLSWAGGDELRSHIAFDAVRKLELGSIHSPLGAAVVPHAWLFPPLAWLTLAFELAAPLAMLSRRAAIVWCWTAWGFHVGVLLLMAIVFPYPLLGLAYAPFFSIERVFTRWVWPVLQKWAPFTARDCRKLPRA